MATNDEEDESNEGKIIFKPDNKFYDKADKAIKDIEEKEKITFQVTIFLFALLSGFLFNLVANFLDDFVKQFGDPTYTIFRIVISSVAVLLIILVGLAVWKASSLINEMYSELSSMSKKGESSPKRKQRQKTYKINELVKAQNWEYMVVKIKEAKALTINKTFREKRVALGKFILVFVSYKNIGRENFEVSRLDFNLIDTNDSKYRSDDTTHELNDLYKLTSLGKNIPPGIECKSVLCFDITPDAKPSKLLFDQAEEIDIRLTQ